MAGTKADLRNAVLRYLHILEVGQSAESEDSALVETLIDREHSTLEAEGVAYWATSSIPDGVMNPLREYIAGVAAPEFLTPEEAAPYVAMRDDAMRRLRRFTSKGDAPVSAEYF